MVWVDSYLFDKKKNMDKRKIQRLISFDGEDNIDVSTGHVDVNNAEWDYVMPVQKLLECLELDTDGMMKKLSKTYPECDIEVEWQEHYQMYSLIVYATTYTTPDNFPCPCDIVVYGFDEEQKEISLSDILEDIGFFKQNNLRTEVGEWIDCVSEDMDSVEYEEEDTDILVKQISKGLDYFCDSIKKIFQKYGYKV